MEKGKNLALIVYQKNQLPLAFCAWAEGCGASREADSKDGSFPVRGDSGEKPKDSQNDSISEPGKSLEHNVGDNSSRPGEKMAKECAEDHGFLANGGSMAAYLKGLAGSKRNGECAGVIPLADQDFLEWMSVNGKDDMSEGACDVGVGERRVRRKVAVKTTHSSALAKRSNPPPPLVPVQAEPEKPKKLLEDVACKEFKEKKRKKRREMKTGDITQPLIIDKEKANFTSSREEKPLPVVEEVPTLLRTDGSSEEHEESDERKLVRETLQKFEILRRKVLREEEIRVKETSNSVKRPDLKAGSIMNSNHQWLNRSKKIGAIPGVEVGDQFYFRIELCIIGLHRQIQAGIDSLPAKESQWDVPLAASIIASGGYEDDLDTGETLIYTGQGGNDYQGNKRQNQDQKLERGNLSLKHSYKVGVPIRVIRGVKCNDSPSGKIYTYDGLYKVEKFWLERGLSGFGVYKFQLQRLPGQLRTTTAIVKFMGKVKSRITGKQPKMISEDISGGKERLKICVMNSTDELTNLPAEFEYITSMLLPLNFEKKLVSEGCSCISGCFDPAVCSCIRRNGGELPYTGDGVLIKLKSMVYECGQQCQCSPTCSNRVSQHGINYRLEIFKKEKGWGLRSLDSISTGSFVCEYIGKVVASNKFQKSFKQSNYVLLVDYFKQGAARDADISMSLGESTRNHVAEEVQGNSFAIDAREYGNIARFINHSTSPNLCVQLVLYDHEDSKLPHVVLFASENIQPCTELTFDRGQDLPNLSDADKT